MNLDERLHHLGSEANATARRLAEELQPPTGRPQRQQLGLLWLAAIVVVVSGVILGVRATQSSEPAAQDVESSFFEPIDGRSGWFAAATIGVEFWLPSQRWQVTGRDLTPHLDQAPQGESRYLRTIISFSTFEPAAGSALCHHLPEAAFGQLGPTDALVSVLEAAPVRATALPERRRASGIYVDEPGRFYRSTGGSAVSACLGLIPELGTDLGFSGEYIFQSDGRAFEVRVGLGRDVPADVEEQAWRILDRLEFTPR